jgi:hypothetical protein
MSLRPTPIRWALESTNMRRTSPSFCRAAAVIVFALDSVGAHNSAEHVAVVVTLN